jgi:hypothetical protein
MKTTIQSLKKQQAFFQILLFSLVTVIIWVGFSIFLSQQKTEISADLLELAIPLNPNINMDVVGQIEQKKTYTEEELFIFPIRIITQNKAGEIEIVTQGTLPTPSPTAPIVTPSENSTGSATVGP